MVYCYSGNPYYCEISDSAYEYKLVFSSSDALQSIKKIVILSIFWWTPYAWMCFDNGFGTHRYKKFEINKMSKKFEVLKNAHLNEQINIVRTNNL
jgi:hypothetical protein